MHINIKRPEVFDCKKQLKELYHKPNIVNRLRGF